jgi:hypothetical protein
MNHQEKKADNGPYISLLQNSPFYFLQCAYLVKGNKHFRLVVIHQGKVLMDKTYETVRGAHIAFAKAFKKRSWKEQVKADWTDFYSPDCKWFEEKAA